MAPHPRRVIVVNSAGAARPVRVTSTRHNWLAWLPIAVCSGCGGECYQDLTTITHAPLETIQPDPETPPAPTGKADLLSRIHHSRAALEQALGQLSDDQMTRHGPDGWSVKDHLAHLTAWEQGISALLQGRPRYAAMGVDEAIYLHGDEEQTNAMIYERNRERSLTDVMAAFEESHRQIIEVLEGMEEAGLLRPYSHYQPDESQESQDSPVVYWVVGNTFAHYDEHRRSIEARDWSNP